MIDIEDALLHILCTLDDAFRAGRFHVTDQILATVDADAPVELLVDYLSASFPARELLPSRPAFAERVRERLLRERGPEKCAAVLRGLVP